MAIIKMILTQLVFKLISYYFRADFIIALTLCKTRRYVFKSKTKLDDLIWKQGYNSAKEDNINIPCENLL